MRRTSENDEIGIGRLPTTIEQGVRKMLMEKPALVLTLGTALTWNETAAIDDTRRRDHASAIRRACAWFGTEPDKVPANPAVLRRMFRSISPGTAGVEKSTFQKVKSNVFAVLRLMGIAPTPLHKFPPCDKWKEALDVVTNEYDRIYMMRFARYHSLIGVDPQDVTDASARDLLRAFENEFRMAKPERAHRAAVAAWNRLADNTNIAWPRTKLVVPNYTRRYALDWDRFHSDFHGEVEAYLNRKTTADPFDLSAPLYPLKPSSAAAYRQNFRLFASCLVNTGTDPQAIRSLADLFQLEAVERGLRYLVEQRKARGLAAEIAKLLAFTAKSLGAGDKHAEKIASIGKRLRGKQKGLCRKVRERLRPLKHEPTLAKLYLLPLGLTDALVRKKDTSISDARLFQLALALAILTVCPLRIGSLCALRLDRHLNWSAGPLRGELTLEFEEDELKNGEPASFPLPQSVAKLIRVYCTRFRPLLNPGPSPFLFCGRDPARPRSKTCFSEMLTKLTFQRLGLRANPHLFRHTVHLIVLRRLPAAYAMVASILGHRALSTTIRNYSYFDGEISMRAYQRLVHEAMFGAPCDREAGPAATASALDWHQVPRRVRR